MAYLTNIPVATDDLDVSQPQILNNFNAISTSLAKDHVAFGLPGEGKHLFNQDAVPTVASSTQVGMYCAALGGKPELYINKEVDTLPQQWPFTATNKTGWTVLPSGIKIKWGTGAIGANTSITVTFSVGTDATCNFVNAPSVTANLNYAGTATQGCFVSSITSTNFSLTNPDSPSGARTYTYIAIGY